MYAFGCTIVGCISEVVGRKKLILIGLTGLLAASFVIICCYQTIKLKRIMRGIFIWAIVGYGYIPSYQARLVEEYPNETGKVMAWNITAFTNL
jgi:MFS family permease